MTYSDSDPNRRNTVIISASIIFYHLSGAYWEQSGIKLPLINLNFHTTEYLPCLVFVLLLWFYYRYYQTRKLSIKQHFDESMNSFATDLLFEEYIKKYNEINTIKYELVKPGEGEVLSNYYLKIIPDKGWVLQTYCKEIEPTQKNPKWHPFILKNELARSYVNKLKRKSVIHGQTMSTQLVPHLLFWWAITLHTKIYYRIIGMVWPT